MSLAVEPLNLSLMILIVGALVGRYHRRTGRCLCVSAVVFCYLLATPLVSVMLLEILESEVEDGGPGPRSAQVIVILGGDLRHDAPEYAGDTVGRLSLARIRYGARLYRESGLPILVTGGPIGQSKKPVSETMKRALEIDFGVPVHWTETRSRNTFENAKFSAEILRSADVDTVYLVTHFWHMVRALEAFQRAGLQVVPKAMGSNVHGRTLHWSDLIPRANGLADSAYAIHEFVGRLWYQLAYYSSGEVN